MKNLNQIGIKTKEAEEISVHLNVLLSSFQIYYQNLRGFHWNITGKSFFELHLKFEELYNDALIKVDEIAERVLTLGQTPNHSFSSYLEISKINEIKNCTDGNDAIQHILDQLAILLGLERDLLSLASENNDEGTVALMSGYIQAQEKLVWMLTAWSK